MWYLINSWKLLSENPQPTPLKKIHIYSPIFTHSPLKIQKIQNACPPLFLPTLKIFQAPSPPHPAESRDTMPSTWQTFTCLKSTIETLEKELKFVQS